MILETQRSKRQNAGLIIGPAIFIVILFLPTTPDLSQNALYVAAISALMASWWISEAIPIPATALLPLVLFPSMNVMSMQDAASSYANHLIFLFLGGFLLAACIQRWNLHKRIALQLIALIGNSANRIILGFMLASGFLSMWVSNTATAMMMLPIGMAIIYQLESDSSDESSPFGSALMLGIAYSASIGGVATLIGTPPNAILAGVAEKQLGFTINFFDWFIFAFPLAVLFLFITWYLLTQVLFKVSNTKLIDDKNIIQQQLISLGPLGIEEKRVLGVFLITAFLWMIGGLVDFDFLSNIKDSTIAIAAAISLFIIPAGSGKGPLLDWESSKSVPWDILILFGGGFALANAFSDSGLTLWLANQLVFLQGTNELIIVSVLVLLVIFLTEITSNTATATIFLPLMVALGDAMQIQPIYLMVPVAIAASYAFMLPVATPPNAIVFSSRKINIALMAKTGFWLNIIGSILIVMFVVYFMPLLWDL